MTGPKLRDVASLAGVSTATVSRALNGDPSVSDANVERVLAAARALGYRRNHVAASLRRQVSTTIGLVVPEIANPFFPVLVEALEAELDRSDRQLLLCESRRDVTVEARQLEALAGHQVGGILISPCDATASRQAVSHVAQRVPLVQIDRRVDDEPFDWVGVDDEAGLGMLLSHLGERGARSVVFVSAQPENSSGQKRLAAFLDICLARDIEVRSVLLGAFSLEWGVEAAARIARYRNLPDAVVCGNDLIAIGLIRELTLRGKHVPHDVLVSGFDDIPLAQMVVPSLTTVRQPYGDIVSRALELLDDQRSNADRSAQQLALAPALAIRESTVKNEEPPTRAPMPEPDAS